MTETLVIHAMPGYAAPARALSFRLKLEFHDIDIHTFPDGESLVTIVPGKGTAIVFCSLDRPNEKLIDLMLAASALRDGGVARLVLVAPYMCYMRQDVAFAPGQAVSQRTVGRFLGGLFDRIVTVDPHLHRTPDISAVFPGAEATTLSAAPSLAEFLATQDEMRNPALVGPDAESRQWVEAVAAPLGLNILTAEKTRRSDIDVSVNIPGVARIAGRPVVIVDDVISSGNTLARCAELLLEEGATKVNALAVHCLANDAALVMLRRAGIGRIVTTDSIPHPTNAIALAPLLAAALASETDI